ncbi:CHASE2 domain-containing protein [Arcobacter sp. CECT 8985]|uniref:CHASE2 domain-containing protein n=1 Tax=Arcobacter sp. CECT 8985 TaxID=1935424 RepID=UPI00100A6E1B|nr:CHASE2 domain-containing protein [Arcobacter sp. CECT 8985]
MEQFNLLDIANTISLRNIASSIENKSQIYIDENKSLSILIDDELYEKEFQSTSPLNKDKLYIILSKIISKKPKNIIIDLDISPDYNFQNNKNTNNSLYKLLKKHSKNINFTLPFAIYSKTKENKSIKRTWMKNMCKNGISFAIPFIHSQMGISLNFYDYKNSLYNTTLKNNSVCKNLLNSKNGIYTLLKKYKNDFKNSKEFPINFENSNSSNIILTSINQLNSYSLKDKTIFLGGKYGYSDKYLTPYGEKVGTQIHEAIFYTQTHKINNANTSITVFADLFLAFTFGLLLEKILEFRKKAQSLNIIAVLNILLFIFLILFIFISSYISSHIYHNFYIWLNPIPLIIGMFLDSIIGLSQKENINKDILNWKNILYYLFVLIFIILGVYSILLTSLNL